jgi:hypothetical protein
MILGGVRRVKRALVRTALCDPGPRRSSRCAHLQAAGLGGRQRLRDPAPIGWQARAPNLARAFAWSRALATIDRLTGEIAPRAKQTVRKALGAAVHSRQPAAGYITPFTEMRVGAGVLAIKARRLQRTRSIRAARPLLFRRLHRQSTGALTSRAGFPSRPTAFAIACLHESRWR